LETFAPKINIPALLEVFFFKLERGQVSCCTNFTLVVKGF